MYGKVCFVCWQLVAGCMKGGSELHSPGIGDVSVYHHLLSAPKLSASIMEASPSTLTVSSSLTASLRCFTHCLSHSLDCVIS